DRAFGAAGGAPTETKGRGRRGESPPRRHPALAGTGRAVRENSAGRPAHHRPKSNSPAPFPDPGSSSFAADVREPGVGTVRGVRDRHLLLRAADGCTVQLLE